MQRPPSQCLLCAPTSRLIQTFPISHFLQVYSIFWDGKSIIKFWISYGTLGHDQSDMTSSSIHPSRTCGYTTMMTSLPWTLDKKKSSSSIPSRTPHLCYWSQRLAISTSSPSSSPRSTLTCESCAQLQLTPRQPSSINLKEYFHPF